MRLENLKGLSMGGTWSAMLQPGSDIVRAQGLIQAALDRVENQMSAWRPNSVLCQINAAPLGHWIDLPRETADVVGAGLGLMAELPGVFSVLMGGASAREGFAPGRACAVSTNAQAVEFDGQRLCRHEHVALDLNAIAKGYAVDLAVESLRANGFANFLVEVAGDIRCDGLRADGAPWSVAMELPIPDRIIPAQSFPLKDEAIATSGGYRRSKGARSHLIDPLTAQPLAAQGASVAVIASTAMQADGWATVMSVLGVQDGLKLAESRGLSVIFIDRDGAEGFIERGSQAMVCRVV
ncbi:MAG: FAD:protein FMN transferase [Pelagimonas sp.]|nr:FAD:protein FMN transferase [Pelagimonas sp.]